MKRELVKKSIAIAAFSSLLIGSASPALVRAAGTDARKSAWTAETAPKENAVQVAPRAGEPNAAEKPVLPGKAAAAASGGRIIVKYKPGFRAASASILPSAKTKGSLSLPGAGASLVQLANPADTAQVLEALNKDPNVLFAEPDFRINASRLRTEGAQASAPAKDAKAAKAVKAPEAGSPDDTYFPLQWALRNTGQVPPFNYNDPLLEGHPGPAGLDVKAPEAWTVSQGSPDVTVAVIDTGVQPDHPDLAGSIWTHPKERAGNGIDDDGNGFVDDVHGWNFAGGSNETYSEIDGDAHGTAVAGLISAAANNGTGLAGVAPDVTIMPVKYVGGGYGYVSDLIKAIAYAETNGAQIAYLNAESYDYSQALKDAIDASSMLFVAGSGDYGVNTDGIPSYPASFDSPNILSVTGIDNEGRLAAYANTGYKSVDVAAPGEAVAATVPVSNPGLAAEIADPANGSKVIFNGIAFENILDDEDADYDYRQDAFDAAMDYLGASKYDPDKKILLVQDDLSNYTEIPSSSKLAKYTDLLADYAGQVDVVQSAPDGGDGPSAQQMRDYDAVIWFTGMADRYYVSNLTENDRGSLTDFIQGGGHLMLTGTNVLNGPTEEGGEEASSIIDTPFVKDVLHLAFVNQYFYDTAVGLPDTIYAYKEYPLDEDKDSYNWIISRDPSIAKIDLMSIAEDFEGSSYAYARGTDIAAAQAAGAAALVLSQDESLSALAAKQRVVNSGTRLSSLMGKTASGRLINAYQALSDDDVPGTPFPGGSVSNRLDDAADRNDVFAAELHAGEEVSLALTGGAGTDFDLYLYAPEAATVESNANLLAYSENEKTSKESIAYKVTRSGTYYVDVYAHKGKGAYTLAFATANGIGGYEDTSKSLAFAGNWTSMTGGAYTGGSMKQIDAEGSVEFAFDGSYFAWIGSKNPKQGIAGVYVDGKLAASPSLYAAKPLDKQTVFEKQLPDGRHAVKIVWTGKHDPKAKKSDPTFINVDAFDVKRLLQESDYGVAFAGQWTMTYGAKHFGGKSAYSAQAGSSATVTFEGTKATVYANVGKDRGKANVYIDGELATPDAIDLYEAADRDRAVVFESGTLSPGKHALKIVNLGEKNPLSRGTVVSLDAVAIAAE
ncbi:pre-peptidase C-terminal domain-containing protein [Paenibacillus sp. UNC496MF]|uniref:S8 family serine peptidase n=1 Tax=Paenibacillus sp. UNC496MF TaxID=1502753 RepID=UPI0008ECE41B|nr:S8 family serine peptidase [Paenibacillus sp. UNC496MF]SFJ50363.1 pre-peptidase C-terminal domain-containing protein [Paenibacillus sp. UNC496MF]